MHDLQAQGFHMVGSNHGSNGEKTDLIYYHKEFKAYVIFRRSLDNHIKNDS